MREFSPFRASSLTVKTALSHQSSKEETCGCGVSAASPMLCRMTYQNCLANTHLMRRCWMFSSSWSHSRQRSGWGRPLRANLSAI
jgi:hypothetical protein